jgi:hypothetical protein
MTIRELETGNPGRYIEETLEMEVVVVTVGRLSEIERGDGRNRRKRAKERSS